LPFILRIPYLKNEIKNGDLQTSFQALKKSIELFPNHASTKEILKELEEKFSVL
jgi:hypothetical protein